MKKLIGVIFCHLTFFFSFAMDVPDTIKAVSADVQNVISPDLNNLINQLNEGGLPEDIGNIVNQLTGMQQMMEGFQNSGNLLEQRGGDLQMYEFSVPAELINILPEGNRMLGNASCFLTPYYAVIKFDAMNEGNDGKGYSFSITLNILNPDNQDTEIKGLREVMELAFTSEMESIKKGEHPRLGDRLSDIKIKGWGGGGSFKWTAKWDGDDLIRYSSYYTGKVNDVFINMEADGDGISIPEQVADKLSEMARNCLTYNSLKDKIKSR